MPASLQTALLFLVTVLFDLYLTILGVRLILAYSQANYFNPIIRFVIVMSQPIVSPLRRIIPNFAKIEFSTLLLIIIFESIKASLILLISGSSIHFGSLLVYSLMATVSLILSIFFYSILIFALLSWIQPGPTPLYEVLSQVTAPILRPLRRLLPLVGGFDLSPLLALILLQLALFFV